MQFEYKFVKVDLKTGFFMKKPVADYHAIVDRHASQGWRLVQIFAPPIHAYGSAPWYELIFEREKASA